MKKTIVFAGLVSHLAFADTFPLPDPHQHSGNVHSGYSEINSSIVVQATNSLPDQPGRLVKGDYEAIVATGEGINSPNQDCIFIYNTKTNQAIKLHHQYLPWRSISGLTWIDEKHLAFDVYANPNFAHHFVFDITLNKVVWQKSFEE